jgi:ankyrin repeat protein
MSATCGVPGSSSWDALHPDLIVRHILPRVRAWRDVVAVTRLDKGLRDATMRNPRFLADWLVGRHGARKALEVASHNGVAEVVAILLRELQPSSSDDGVGDALVCAASAGRGEVVQMLCARGGIGQPQANLSLMLACACGHADVASALLTGGFVSADVNGGAGVLCAAIKGHVDVVRVLLGHGAPPDSSNGHPIVEACRRGDVGMVRLLMEHGARVDGRDGEALIAATGSGNPQLVQLLLEGGATTDQRHGMAIVMAVAGNDAGITNLLLRQPTSFV